MVGGTEAQVVLPAKKLEDLIRLAELCVDLLRQNEEFYAEVKFCDPEIFSDFDFIFIFRFSEIFFFSMEQKQLIGGARAYHKEMGLCHLRVAALWPTN